MLIEKYDERDYMLSGENDYYIDVENPYRYKEIEEYNQLSKEKYKSSCTIFGFMGSAGYNCGITFTQEEIEKASDKAIEDGIVNENGAYFINAVNFVRKYINKYYNKDLVSFRIGIKDEAFKKALDKGWSIGMGFQYSRTLKEDTEKDGIADEKKYPLGTGHLVYYLNKENDNYVINSYGGLHKYNQFKFLYFEDLLKTNFFFNYGYIIMPKKSIIESDQFAKDIADMEEALRLGITKDKGLLEELRKGNYSTMVRVVIMLMRSRRIK